MNIQKMLARLKIVLGACLTAGFCIAPCFSQELTSVIETKIDTLIVSAYRTAAEEFPCKMKTSGKLKMIKWQDVEKCLNDAEERIDWEDLTRQIEALREEGNFSRVDVYEAVESSMSAHAITYDRVFNVKKKDALLPLSNTASSDFTDETL